MVMSPRDVEIRAAVDAALASVTPTLPIGLADVEELWRILRPLVLKSEGYLLDMRMTALAIQVAIFYGWQLMHERTLTARAG